MKDRIEAIFSQLARALYRNPIKVLLTVFLFVGIFYPARVIAFTVKSLRGFDRGNHYSGFACGFPAGPGSARLAVKDCQPAPC